MSFGISFARQSVKVNSLGKWKTAFQMVSMSLLLLLRQPLQVYKPDADTNGGAEGGGTEYILSGTWCAGHVAHASIPPVACEIGHVP